MTLGFLKNLNAGNEEVHPRGHLWLLIILMLLAFTAAVLFFSRNADYEPVVSQTRADERAPRVYSVFYKNETFSPTNIRVREGDTVRFENDSLFGVRIVSDDLAGFDSVGPIPPGGVFTYTFAASGIYSYHNEKNEDQLGKVIVR